MADYHNKDEQRAAVLKYYYQYNEQYPGGYAQTSQVVQATGLEPKAVLEAQQYLVDKYMLDSNENQQLRGGGMPGVRAFIARITASGIDFVEHPEEWRGRGIPEALVKIVAQNLNYAGGDQQIVGGDASGIVAQGNAAVANLAPFPAAELRAALSGDPEALAAVDSIDAELKTTKPKWGKIAAAAEIVKAASKVGDAAQALHRWLADPAVSHAITHGVRALFSS